MKRIATYTLVVSLFATAAFAATEGRGRRRSMTAARPLHINLTEAAPQHGTTMKISAFTGLTHAQIDAATMTPVQFEMRRESRLAVFEGTFRKGKGAGQFTFTPNRAFLDTVRAMGIEINREKRKHRERDEEGQLFALALRRLDRVHQDHDQRGIRA
jgi:hypothetical protein